MSSYYQSKPKAVELHQDTVSQLNQILDGMIEDLQKIYDTVPNDFQKEQVDKVGRSIQFLKKKIAWKRKQVADIPDWRQC